MKKKLLVLAVGTALVAPLAQADGPQVYGKINLSLEHMKYDPAPGAPANDDEWELQSNASRFGIRGDFDLDVAGLKALYQVEFEIAVDDGDNKGDTLSQRNIFAGLQGAFGTLRAGRFDTPTKEAQGKIDQFNDLDGDMKHIASGEVRASNIIAYTSPKLGGLVTFNAAFIPAEDEDDFDGDGSNENGLADSTSISLVLEKNGFYGALAHDSDIQDELLVDATGSSPTLDITRVVAGLKMDRFELGALFENAREAEGDGEENSYLVSGAYRIERVKLKAQYGRVKGDQTDNEGTQYALGLDYALAKNAKVYGYYNNLKYEFDNGSPDDKTQTVGVGMELKF